ncbi:MAG: hypothetical protein AAGH89_06895 [Verrucomicrobiota bacterium]
MVRTLDASKVLKTALKLQARMKERFPSRGITEVVADVCTVSGEAAEVAKHLRRPMIWYRVIATIVIMAIVVGLIILMFIFRPEEELGFVDLVQTFEAGVNDLIFIALAIFFMVRLERRLKRQKALDMLHKLRSLAHIIDMHQLTKDPDSIVREDLRTSSSPVRDMTPYEIKRYFDYCSEMLAILSKLAALMVQDFDDLVTLNAVNEIENLTSGLSRKIWQKITVATRTEIVPSAAAKEG